MGGSATLGTNLVDSLVEGVIDGIRGALHPDLGVRRFRVFVVTRTYTGEHGLPPFSDAEIELDPQPLVESYAEQVGESIQYKLEECGIDEAGVVVLKEISLMYTEAELVGPPAEGLDMFVRIEDAHGQGMPPRYFTPLGPPFPDVTKGMGWEMKLKRRSAP